MRESWTDARLDDFRADVDRRFDKVEGDISELRGEMRELRAEMKSGFEAINRTMLHGVIALSAAYIAGFAAIVTQL
ncbi:MAG TPA: hypothetical protein VH042_12305 [Solirubrobacterales bacterium]|nr:hypothetical protein [Solirubrobacterales bacterium]